MNLSFTFLLFFIEVLALKKPFQRDVLVGSVGQGSSNGDGEYPALELSKGNVDGVRKSF